MNQGTNLGSQIGRWIVLAAVVAVLGALLLTIRPVGAQDQDLPPTTTNAQRVYDYPENGDDIIAPFSSADPEGKNVIYTLGGLDAADFMIDGKGNLSFKTSPNFEAPTDRGRVAAAEAPNTTPPTAEVLAEEGKNNVYMVTVRIGGGGEDGTPGDVILDALGRPVTQQEDSPLPDAYKGDDLREIELTVNVTNMNEDGTLRFSPIQPQIGTPLRAILTDEDNIDSDRDNDEDPLLGEWQWYSSPTEGGTFTPLPGTAAAPSNKWIYTPTDDDLGKYLQVRVRYRDSAGPEAPDEWKLEKDTAHPVRHDISTSNDEPKYPDQSTLTGVNSPSISDPTEGRTITDRFIRETAAAGDIVGAPVTAFDDDATIDILTYSLRDPADSSTVDDDEDLNTPAHKDGHARLFDIDPESGQITVGVRAVLEAALEADGGTDPLYKVDPYNVLVRAVDADGDISDITVNIHVLEVGEPPKIDRVYQGDETSGERPSELTTPRYEAGDRVPTEITHWEWDRTRKFRLPTELDTDLDTSVLRHTEGRTIFYNSDSPYDPMRDEQNLQPAVYTASDPDRGDIIEWTLEGADAGSFVLRDIIDEDENIIDENKKKKLEFKKKGVPFPDFENPENKDTTNKNIYEVTIVVKDSTVDKQGNPHEDKLNVTVKVIDSTEDNEPGMVTIANRQPEVKALLTATLTDPDSDTPEDETWQWYRAVGFRNENGVPGAGDACITDTRTGNTGVEITPEFSNPNGADLVNELRHFLEIANPGTQTDGTRVWEVIEGAMSSGYTPVVADLGRCLRATVTYSDGVNPTSRQYGGLEATFAGTEWPVKRIDTDNDPPIFTANGVVPDDGVVLLPPVAEYTAMRDENTTDLIIGEAKMATDTSVEEDDVASPYGSGQNDRLTYKLDGEHSKFFKITGSVGYNSTVTADLSILDGQLELLERPDFETNSLYRVTIMATDPTGEHSSVDVEVIIEGVNEKPDWVKSEKEVAYPENATKVVSTYLAKDPDREHKGIEYFLVDKLGENETVLIPAGAATDDPNIRDVTITAADTVDRDLFVLDSQTGKLKFKTSPNFEKPKDSAMAGQVVGDDSADDDAAMVGDNVYRVAVRAVVKTDTDTALNAIALPVRVTVANVNEAPVFSKATDTLEIKENLDDPNKEPPAAEGYLYLLNRGVGIPNVGLPTAPNLDVGIPVLAVDDDNTFTTKDYTGTDFARGTLYSDTTNRPIQMIDGLTYELIGTDAAAFDIVPATGQILTVKKLDYEIKKEYRVRVKATDPWHLPGDLSATMDLTIKVNNLTEVPVLLEVGGERSHTHEENAEDNTVGDYNAIGSRGKAVTWSLDGPDADSFMIDRTGTSTTLKFSSAPDYEMPRGKAKSNTNTNTYMVTVKAQVDDQTAFRHVAVVVTDEEELGTLAGDDSSSYVENSTEAVGTYTLVGTAADEAKWSLGGADGSDHFKLEMVEGSDASRMLKFRSAPDYESPMGGDDDDSNTYMVTVMAESRR